MCAFERSEKGMEFKMKLIERKYYLDKLIRGIDTLDIKVITGVRRSVKSKLLTNSKILCIIRKDIMR